ncbi:hypothetical protein JKG68_23545 [Microvirga aerilata]|jgi:hypothetical protein|uniref:Uncharacterized protein n=1 Tax=Microvirga aerilata TaxID=670292 RepID=A0A937D1E7_9HYPH|nr:hypothetical protein [Microvirga aerilata]MBL0406921.1 hypothetical protein [Microvirga aerilata]
MALRWKPTIPADNNPEDVVGSLHRHIFARVYRVPNGSDQGRFRWYLNDVPASAGVQLQGAEETQRKAQQAANFQFQQWLKRAGLREAPMRAKRQVTLALQEGPAPKGSTLNRKAQASAVLVTHESEQI